MSFKRDHINIEELDIYTLVNGPYKQNCYVIVNKDNRESIVVDPGIDGEKILEFLITHELKLTAILLTHGHFDHLASVDMLVEKYNVKCWVDAKEKKLIRQAGIFAYKILGIRLLPPSRLCYFDNTLNITWAGGLVRSFSTPGHTLGSCCYYFNESLIFTGDTLFNSAIGPTIYTESSYQELLDSVENLISQSNGGAIIFPGHGLCWNSDSAKIWWELTKNSPAQFKIFKQ